ncbi:hypothetical protein [Micromonospora cathayae]|uniref:Uncharacterized protein n=1 Tax=Micromonospora cathayae TaxID=3028804 RepID=A0ABY7ZYW2_9ACTN|nr:hypothetical protein [Micromonospora sp. HUAS 3]WDZ87203.1 hypothetical protein PVK37_12745 [Micromonospora sp. HUAS 3]
MDQATALERDDALTIGLEAAVQLHMLTLRHMHPDLRDDLLARWAAEAGPEIGSKGDILQFRSSKRGETAAVFNHLARGLTALAHQPGGVTFAGMHWCTDHQQCRAADQAVAARPSLLNANPDEPEPDQPTYGGRPLDTITPAREYL